jgi:hypothetical protein
MARKRVFAAPFILTSTLIACGPPAGGAGDGETIHRNPPPPDHEQPPPDETPTDQNAALPDAPTDAQGTIEKRDDGSCWFVYAAPECPPNTLCNPPPPKQVKCTE